MSMIIGKGSKRKWRLLATVKLTVLSQAISWGLAPGRPHTKPPGAHIPHVKGCNTDISSHTPYASQDRVNSIFL